MKHAGQSMCTDRSPAKPRKWHRACTMDHTRLLLLYQKADFYLYHASLPTEGLIASATFGSKSVRMKTVQYQAGIHDACTSSPCTHHERQQSFVFTSQGSQSQATKLSTQAKQISHSNATAFNRMQFEPMYIMNRSLLNSRLAAPVAKSP